MRIAPILAVAAIGFAGVARAETISLTCEADILASKKHYTFQLEYDGTGVTQVIDNGYRQYTENKHDSSSDTYVRVSDFEIAWGSKFNSVKFENSIDRTTGVYLASFGQPLDFGLKEKGICKKIDKKRIF